MSPCIVTPAELMLHRRLFRDDGLGVGENLNELEYGTGELNLIYWSTENVSLALFIGVRIR